MGILATIIIGALAGWLGSTLYKGNSLGLLWNIIVGIAGVFIGTWLFGVVGISLGSGWISAIITGAIGAIVLLFVINLIKGKN